MKKIIAAFLISVCLYSCSKENSNTDIDSTKVQLTIGAKSDLSSKTVIDGSDPEHLVANWLGNEAIGVVATKDNSFTDAIVPEFVGSNDSPARSASFSGTLTDKGAGDYTLYGVYPFQSAMSTKNDLKVCLPYIQHPEAGSWDVKTDFMVGVGGTETGASGIAGISDANKVISFSHVFGWLNLTFAGFTGCESERVRYVRISTGNTGNAIAGNFSINLIGQNISTTGAEDKFILADYSDKNITLGELSAYITMFPGSYSKVDIAVKTTDHYIECSRTDLTITAGSINCATVNYIDGTDNIGTSQANLCGTLPSMPSKTDGNLNVLLLGHSFGIDCTEHLPGLLEYAGITNLNLCRFFSPDCSLKEYWAYITDKTSPYSFEQINGSGWKTVTGGSRVVDQIANNSWDIIIMQQSTCDGRGQTAPDWGGSADYSTYQPYLSLMIEYFVCTQETRMGNCPFIVWNMIHSSRSSWEDKYAKIVTATTRMKAETGMELILTPGTAMQKARLTEDSVTYGFNFSDASTYHLLCRDLPDGWHASQGLGRYLMACTWFEQLVCPIYKAADENLTVVGNTYYPADKCVEGNWGDNDTVTAEKAAALQAIAHDTKLVNPFSATNPQ